MAIDFKKWNEQFGGEQAKQALKDAESNAKEYSEVPDGTYICKREKLELGETKDGKPMIKGMFRIVEGNYKKQCLFVNQVFCKAANGSGFPIHKGLEFLRSLEIFEDADVDFDGDYETFNDLLLDMAEEAENESMKFEVLKEKDGEYTRLSVTDVL